jgi:RTA1 like protein
VSLILQGAGGGIAATAGPGNLTQANLGTNIIIAGLSFQVFSLLLFMILCVDFALRIRKVPEPQRSEEYQALRRTKLFKGFLLGMLIKLWAIFTQIS